MSSLVQFAVAVVAAQAPISIESEAPSDQMGRLTADQLTYDRTGNVLSGRGHCILQTVRVSLWADEMQYDRVRQHAVGRGNVMMVSGLTTAVGDEVEVDLATDEAIIKGGLLLQKRNVKPEALLAASTPEQLRKLGQTTLLMTGDYIKRVEPRHFFVKHLSFTPCDCDFNKPSWRIDAWWADVQAGERAILWLPVIYVHSVPVLPLPVLYLPLTDRRSGFLVPRPASSALNGFSLDVPIFVTLGRSYDMTLTPGYYWGEPEGSNHPYGIRGPRLQSEFRYVPSSLTSGRITFGVIDDLRDQRNPIDPSIPVTDPADPSKPFHHSRGLRWEAGLQHDQDLGAGFYDRIDANLVSDGYFVRDLQADIVARVDQYLRSTAVVFHRDPDSYADLDVAFRQDLRWGYSLFNNDRLPDGMLLRGPNTLQRLPALVYDIPERHLRGPLFGSLHLEYTRIAPITGETGDEGRDGVFNPVLAVDPDGSQGDRRFEPGEREARNRIDFRPRISANFGIGSLARITPYAAYREDLYVGEITGTVSHRGYPMAGMIADSEIARTFGAGSTKFRHSLAPSVEFRYVPPVLGSGWPQPYDEVDAAVPNTGLTQVVTRLSQRLSQRVGTITRDLIRFDVGQGFDLRHRSLADAYAKLNLFTGPLSSFGVVRYNLSAKQLAQISTGANLAIGPRLSFHASYENLLGAGPDRLRAGIDALTGPSVDPSLQLLPLFTSRAQQVVAGLGANLFFGFGVGYEAFIKPVQLDPTAPVFWSLEQQTLNVSYAPACDCWRLTISAALRPNPNHSGLAPPDFAATLTISRFGSLGVSGQGASAFAN